MRGGWTTYIGILFCFVLIVGCVDPGSSDRDPLNPEVEETLAAPGEDPTEEPDDGSSQGTPEPTPEPPGNTEGPGDPSDTVRIELAELQIGGEPEIQSDTLQCVDVVWSGPPEVPDELVVEVTAVKFEPSDAFAISRETCRDAGPDCVGATLNLEIGCTVAIAWTGDSGDERRRLHLAGAVECPASATAPCETFREEVADATSDGAGIRLKRKPADDNGGDPSIDDDGDPADDGSEDAPVDGTDTGTDEGDSPEESSDRTVGDSGTG
jgi:hypothetical protein